VPFDREQIEARLALELIASADMPKMAQDALEAGLEGPATLRLAILENPTYFEVAEVLPRVVNELGLAHISLGEAGLRLAKKTARDILREGDDPLPVLQIFSSLWVRSNYAEEIQAVGHLRA
jgi:hypothetical protein